MLVVRLRSANARESYVRLFLSQHVDSFATEIILIKQPDTLNLSVGKVLDPVISWLRAQGCDRAELSAVLASAPEVLQQSVDMQLQPLADTLEAAGGPGTVRSALVAYPALAVTPAYNLAAALEALQLSQEEARRALETMGDMLAQLMEALEESGGGSGCRCGGGSSMSDADVSAAKVAAEEEEEEQLVHVRTALRAALAEQPGTDEHHAACSELELAIDGLAVPWRQKTLATVAAAG